MMRIRPSYSRRSDFNGRRISSFCISRPTTLLINSVRQANLHRVAEVRRTSLTSTSCNRCHGSRVMIRTEAREDINPASTNTKTIAASRTESSGFSHQPRSSRKPTLRVTVSAARLRSTAFQSVRAKNATSQNSIHIVAIRFPTIRIA